MYTTSRVLRFLALLALAAALAGCQATRVDVQPLLDFPHPLVAPLPAHIGVYYSEQFRQYRYDETADEQGMSNMVVELGAGQMSLFTQLLPHLFHRVTELESLDRAHPPAGLDAVLVPEVVDFEYSVPRTSKAKVYEVWIKYQFELLGPDSTTIATWTMPAYGKTPTAMLTSDAQALSLASLVALRDAGAALVTGLPQVPGVQQWLRQVGDGQGQPREPNPEVNNGDEVALGTAAAGGAAGRLYQYHD